MDLNLSLKLLLLIIVNFVWTIHVSYVLMFVFLLFCLFSISTGQIGHVQLIVCKKKLLTIDFKILHMPFLPLYSSVHPDEPKMAPATPNESLVSLSV